MAISQLEYSIGLLIVMLVVFWYMSWIAGSACRPVRPQCRRKCGGVCRECMEGSLRYPGVAHKDNKVIVTNAVYGNSPIRIGSPDGVKYIRLLNELDKTKPSVIEIPNSKTAMRRLFDDSETDYKSQTHDENMSQSFSDMHINKKILQNGRNKPSSHTSSRDLIQPSQ